LVERTGFLIESGGIGRGMRLASPGLFHAMRCLEVAMRVPNMLPGRGIGRAAAAALILGAPAAALAVDPPHAIHVGDGTANGSRLRPYDNAWLFSATLPDGRTRAQGIWSDHMDAVDQNGRHVLRRVQGMTYLNGVSQSSVNIFDPATCAPITTEGRGRDGKVFRRTFAGSRVTTERPAQDNAPASTNALDAPEAVFDFYGGMYGLLLSCFPLDVGYSGTFTAVDEFTDVATPVTFSVVRRERVRAGARGDVDTLVTVVDTPGQYTETFWLAREAPYIIRLVVTVPDHSRTMSFDMI
jgi:hypothetical protein